MPAAYTFRTAQGVWINDMCNRSFPNRQWPCVEMDDRSCEDLKASIRLQAASGFDSLTVFGLLTASSWLPDLRRTVPRRRARQVRAILREAHRCGIKVLYGLGVYSWGFDEIIAHDAKVRGPNPHAMCGSHSASKRWMEKVADYLLDEFDFDGFHLEASDQGRCTCPKCEPESNAAYYSRINAQTAAYIRRAMPDAVLMANMCGYLRGGEQTIPKSEWSHLQELGRHLDFLIDAGHAGFFIRPSQRRQFIRQLPCAYGSSGGVWVYPPQRWNRRRWFIPYTRRTGDHLASLYAEGGRAVEYYMGPAYNPGVEVNIAFGGRKLGDVDRDNHDILLEVVESLYSPANAGVAKDLARLFEEAEEAFFDSFDPNRLPDGRPRGELHLTSLKGTHPGTAHYLQVMDPRDRRAYGRRLRKLLPAADHLERGVKAKTKVRRIKTCIGGVLADIDKVSA